MKTSLKSILLLVLCIDPVIEVAARNDTPNKRCPNFILLFADDMGYGDIEPFGSTINRTPNLNKMAEQGVRLTSFYAAAVSSPSRAALMTGCYPKRVGLEQGIGKDVVLFNRDSIGINKDEMTLAEVFKEAGYVTGCFGKWHLGDQPEFFPTEHGFDHFVGIPYSHDMWPKHKAIKSKLFKNMPPPLPWMIDDKVVDVVTTMEEQGQMCNVLTLSAIDFIEKSQDSPFFLYLPYSYVHQPRNARAEFVERAKSERPDLDLEHQLLKAQIEELDWSVGEIFKTLEKLGLDENTIVLFTSDNGGTPESCNLPLRGGKGQTWEGGLREPTIIWGKGVIPAGKSCDEIATTMDLVPTFANFLNVTLPNHKIDGKDIMELWHRPEKAKSPHEAFYYFTRDKMEAVRVGDYKLRKDGRLYNLQTDIGEQINIAKNNPDIVAELQRYFDVMSQDIGQSENCRLPGIVDVAKDLEFKSGVYQQMQQ